ncbi:hypothetical protein F3Y22_tig00110384pilonHSYRG00896 [Hibiscus syriacus]|uniref:Uncharacterized protein n=1 Tax=Hibiscus syriacus TaxID=106335 RepID=A0A6A3AX05_HIBSY|nr:hypothetical protein F3Y22_tig00110384pilonHSYRG00896 [Hibiscus syriacus]
MSFKTINPYPYPKLAINNNNGIFTSQSFVTSFYHQNPSSGLLLSQRDPSVSPPIIIARLRRTSTVHDGLPNRPGNSHNSTNPKGKVTVKGKKENVWSIDNERVKAEKEKGRESTKQRRRRKGKRVVSDRKKKTGWVLVSAAMLMEVETVL